MQSSNYVTSTYDMINAILDTRNKVQRPLDLFKSAASRLKDDFIASISIIGWLKLSLVKSVGATTVASGEKNYLVREISLTLCSWKGRSR